MALLGKADTQAHSGQLDAAIATWKDMSTTAANDLSVYSVAATHLVVDITGYFAPTP